MASRWRYTRIRRGRIFDYPRAAQVASAPRVISWWSRRRTRAATPARRGDFLSVPQSASTIPTRVARRARRTLLPRRGEFFPVANTPPVAAAPAWSPPAIRRTPRRANVRSREHLFEPPWPQQAATAPALPPAATTRRRRNTGPTARGAYFGLPAQDGAGAVAQFRPQHHQPRPFNRPGVFATPPQPGYGTPDLVAGRRPCTARVRRVLLLWTPPPPAAAVPPPAWVPDFRLRRRPRPHPPRGGFLPVGFDVERTRTIVRPNTGTTARPNTGTTVRPAAGTVSRPSSGTIVRPDTGVVARP